MRVKIILIVVILSFSFYKLMDFKNNAVINSFNLLSGKYMVNNSNENKIILNKGKENYKNLIFNYRGMYIGDSKEKLISNFGIPDRKDISMYGFEWYIYNKNYKEYIQVGIKGNKVVGFFSNSNKWKINNEYIIGKKRDDIHEILKNPMKSIEKSGINYIFNDDNWNMYNINKCYVILFYDQIDYNKVNSILLIEKEIEENLTNYYIENNNDIKIVESLERQNLDLINAFRAKYNKEQLIWDEKAAITARNHSKDMVKKDFFDHINLNNETVFDRMINDNIHYKNAAENIASGQRNSIYALEALLNSKNHRKTILGNYKNIGIGICQGGKYKMYYTQVYYTPN
ncbi:MAG: CAP-associated domain-containing protein [Clostridiales bacterium]